MPLKERREPFSHRDWLYEIKHDGFRALAVIVAGQCRLISRNGNRFARYDELAARIAYECQANDAVLDGEIVCLDPKTGRSVFADLLFHRTEPYFYAFDLLTVEGHDLRDKPLLHRKQWLKAIMPELPSHLLYLDHVGERGKDFYRLCCEWDLEGIVAKRKDGLYLPNRRRSTRVKVKNPEYSQREGREELFERHT